VDELLAQFVVEAAELTQQAADDLLALDRDPENRERLESAFRAIHTLKGSVGLFDLAPLQAVLHAAEDVLAVVLRDVSELDTALIDPILLAVEWVDRCVGNLRQRGELPASAGAEAANLLQALASDRAGAAATPTDLTPEALPQWAAALFEAWPSPQPGRIVALRYSPDPECFFNGDDPVALMASVPDIVFARIATREPWPPALQFDPFRSNLVFEALSLADPSGIEAIFRLLPDQVAIVTRLDGAKATEQVATEAAGEQSRTLRVDVARIDRIVSTAGELLAAKSVMSSLVSQALSLEGGAGLARNLVALQRDLDRLTGQLQRAASDVRMLPLIHALRRLPRVVREISALTRKPLDIQLSNCEIEVDKVILDGIYEPLLHIIRNAVDHGIETEQERLAGGKPAKGRIIVRARRAGYRVELEIADDGRGIDLERIRAAAVDRGIISAEAAQTLSEPQVLELLFAPGFSTARAVTALSGRGVGMDAVREAVRRLGGQATIASETGRGTTVTLSLPTTFAVSRVMTVDVAGEKYGVPMEAILETVRIKSCAIVPVRAGEAFVLRDRTIPVLRLGDIVGRPARARSEELLIVLESGAAVAGLVVDAIGERFETLLRPPTGLLRSVPGISGTAILGDGRIVMVLDVEGLVA
jgi:two-component system, chemotaxis family, sensor kinase CheA